MAAECSPVKGKCKWLRIIYRLPTTVSYSRTVDDGQSNRVRVVGGGQQARVIARILQDGAFDGEDA